MFKIIKGDITEAEVDVIINAANTQLLHMGGVALAIKNKAGKDLIEDSKKIKYVAIGDFAITRAGKLKAKEVFHIPTICYKTGKRAKIKEIKQAFEKALIEAKNKDYKKIATPLLGTGVVGLSEKEVEKVIFEIAENFGDLEIFLYKL